MTATKVLLVLDYIAGYFVFGTIYWLFSGILVDINQLTPGTDLYVWCNFLWAAALVMYIIFGTFYLYRGIREYDVVQWR